jgi:acetyltransferase-like isoleucine patch superfamily enzyme
MEKRFKNWQKPKIEEGKLTEWNWMVQGVKNLDLGEDVDIGAFVYINATEGVIIEDGVQIGGGAKVYSVSTIDNKRGRVILKKNCKIGANSVILPGVVVGENSIIGALSLVNKDVPDNVVAVGCPIKIIKNL